MGDKCSSRRLMFFVTEPHLYWSIFTEVIPPTSRWYTKFGFQVKMYSTFCRTVRIYYQKTKNKTRFGMQESSLSHLGQVYRGLYNDSVHTGISGT
jgi:hypothetical protein